jgi:sugar phosphate isomerase/epimerase
MRPLVAMENALFADPSLDWDRRCALIAAAGFDGIYAVPYPLADAELSRLATLGEMPARHGLRLTGIYANIDLGAPPTAPGNARTRRLFETVTGTPRVELSFKCSDPAALPAVMDDAIASRLEPLLVLAEQRGFDVALYHHSFYPLETPAHAERLVRRLAHPRLGFVFAFSHSYAVCSAEETLTRLRACVGRIASFNVCGCRRPGPPPAKCIHVPLDGGDHEVGPLFRVLEEGGYRGDVIVQGHGWQGDLPALLHRTVLSYRAIGQPSPVSR